jgi:hypothetical protein
LAVCGDDYSDTTVLVTRHCIVRTAMARRAGGTKTRSVYSLSLGRRMSGPESASARANGGRTTIGWSTAATSRARFANCDGWRRRTAETRRVIGVGAVRVAGRSAGRDTNARASWSADFAAACMSNVAGIDSS